MRLVLPLLLIATLTLPGAGRAEDQVPASPAQVKLTLAPVVSSAAPAVVNIYATRLVAQRQSPFADDPVFSRFFNENFGQPRVQNSLGSGVILRQDGIVVSNYHVVGDAAEIRVVLADRREFDARVLLADRGADLAVIQLEGAQDLPALTLADSDTAQVGDFVLAIGNPFGVGQTVTSGIVSGLARPGGNMGRGDGYYIQTDAAINPGNSGGALVDLDGNLLGINTSILTQNGGSNGIGFAIPANLVAQYVSQAEAGAVEVTHPWSGVEVQPVDATLAEALGLSVPHGVILNRLHPDSPYGTAGLVTGDVITAIDGQPVDAPQELDYRQAIRGVGAMVRVTYWHDGVEDEAEVTLAAAPGGDRQPVRISDGTILDGLTVQDLTPQLIDALGLPLDATGVVVTDVAGRAVRAQLAPGDLILALNGQPVTTAADLPGLLAQAGRTVRLEFQRGSQRAVLRLRGF